MMEAEGPPCPHQRLFDGVCTSCMQRLPPNEISKYVPYGSKNDGHMVLPAVFSEMKDKTHEHLRKTGKLILVLDLDHTSVHTVSLGGAKVLSVPPNISLVDNREREALLRRGRAAARAAWLDLFDAESTVHLIHAQATPRQQLLIKLRPGICRALADLSQFCSIYVYTKGTATYAQMVRSLLDPLGLVLEAHVFSREDDESKGKDLDKLFARRDRIVVWDDCSLFWEGCTELLKLEPYVFYGYAHITAQDTKGKCLPVYDGKFVRSGPPIPPPKSKTFYTGFLHYPARPRAVPGLFAAQLATAVDVTRRVWRDVNAADTPSQAALHRLRFEVFHGMRFAYSAATEARLGQYLTARACGAFDAIELTHVITAFGGAVVGRDHPHTHLICEKATELASEDVTPVPPSWVLLSSWLFRRLPLDLVQWAPARAARE
eukprot:gnl/Chilomastix_cuspidata/2506.p1 GENE.gnl/Chilomastix_cuspidata/2506~~gnl/Chilomastix_cuspidata/2506.p1  ORF type:complete len:432 (+),score=64.23 gnl/Chilomastix_cuspidata/2506:1322-2617(+)